MWRTVPLDPGQPARGSLALRVLSYSSQPGDMETAGPCSLQLWVSTLQALGRRHTLKAAILISSHLGGQSWELHFEILASMTRILTNSMRRP